MLEKSIKSEFIEKTVKIGRRGQITLPRIIRKIDKLKEKDELKVTRMPSGELHFRKITKEHPVDRMLSIIETFPKINFDKTWKEVQSERRESER